MFKSKIQSIALLLLSCFPLIGMRATVWAIILFTLVALITGKYNQPDHRKLSVFMLSATLFLMIVVRCLFPHTSQSSLNYIEVSLSLMVLPLAFYLLRDCYSEKRLEQAAWVFIVTTLVAFTFGMGYSILQVFNMQIESADLFSYHIRTFFENIVDYHPTYASVVLGMVIIMLLDRVLTQKGQRWMLISLISLSILILALLASRTPIAATVACSLLLVVVRTRSIKAVSITILSIALVSLIFFLCVPSFSARFKEVSLKNASLPNAKNEDSFNLRTGIFKCGKDLINAHWLWGVGPGNIKAELNKCYDGIAPEVYKGTNFNTHNQFMDYWAGLGIAGLLLLASLIGLSLYYFWKTENWIGLCSILLFAGAMQTENLLTRQNGIVAFCYFIGIHIFVSKINLTRQKDDKSNS